jgi:hypothetical protein
MGTAQGESEDACVWLILKVIQQQRNVIGLVPAVHIKHGCKFGDRTPMAATHELMRVAGTTGLGVGG